MSSSISLWLLCLGLLFPAASQEDIATRVSKVIAEYDQAYDAWYQRYLAEFPEASEEERASLLAAIPQAAEYGPPLMALAAEDPASNAAYQACEWVASNIREGPSMAAAIELLTDHFIDHPGIGPIAAEVLGGEAVNNRFLEAVMESSRPPSVTGLACYNLARGLQDTLASDLPPEEAAQVEARVRECLAECQAEPFRSVMLRGRITIGEQARADLFELDNLRVGKKAPEIEGEDLDGVAFKLSDYRGKVLLLDFWGDW